MRNSEVAAIFGILAMLLAALMVAKSYRPRDSFVDMAGLSETGSQVLCGIASSQVDSACGGDANVRNRLFFGDATMHTTPYCGADGCTTDGLTGNSSDPYYMQKIVTSPNNSSLRLTINDDSDESFQIWGNACAVGNCFGEGAMQHKFRADGTAAHSGSMVLGSPNTATDNGWSSGSYPQGGSLNIFNRHAGNWTHFPWVDGRNYIRNNRQVDGALQVNGTTQVDGTFTVNRGNGDWNWVHVVGNHGDNVYLGSDGGNRGIRAEGARPFSIYQNGATKLSIDDANVNVIGQLCVNGQCLSGSDIGSLKGDVAGGTDQNFGSINVNEKLFFRDMTQSTTPNWGADGSADGKTGNSSDPYFLQKIVTSPNNSSLRLTINDDWDESFQIWGNACAVGNCSGEGAMQHKFVANGDAVHQGTVKASTVQADQQLCVGGTCITAADLLNIKNTVAKEAALEGTVGSMNTMVASLELAVYAITVPGTGDPAAETALSPSTPAALAPLAGLSAADLAKKAAVYTLTMRIRMTNTNGNWRSIFYYGVSDSPSDRSPGVWQYPGTTGVHLRHQSTQDNNSGFDQIPLGALNTWYQLVVSCDGSTMRAYVNGAPSQVVALGAGNYFRWGNTIAQKTPRMRIRDNGYAQASGVQVADIYMLPAALSAADVAALYAKLYSAQ